VLTNPFPGLRSFRIGEEAMFFGRETQVETMVERLAATRLLVVVGTSGSGKSSLVYCGLLPALRGGAMLAAGNAWRVADFRPGNHPIRALAAALASPGTLGWAETHHSAFSAAELMEATLRMGKLGLVDAHEQAHLDPKENLLIFADQFEELFRYQPLASASTADQATRANEDAAAFVNLLLEAGEHLDRPLYIVLTMRSDFLGECAQFFGLPEAINRGQYLVPRMSRDERRLAIAGPVKAAGVEIDPALLTWLVNDVGENPDQLSLLQHALNRTWAAWEKEGASGPLRLPHYRAVGSLAGALNKHAEDAFFDLKEERLRRLAAELFKAITDKTMNPLGTRRPTRVDTLCAIANATREELKSVIEVFSIPSRSFLSPPAGTALKDDVPVDISHESLMRTWDRLRDWSDEEARSSQTYRRLAETAELNQMVPKRAELLIQPELKFVIDWRETQKPGAAWAERYHAGFERALDFLKRSEEAFQKKRRIQLALWAVPMTLAVVGVIAFVISLYFGQRQAARSAEVDADINKRLASAADILTRLALNSSAAGAADKLALGQAGSILDRVLAEKPDSSAARRLAAERLRLGGNIDDAITYCLQAIHDIPGDSQLYGELGYLYSMTRHLDKAIDALKKSVEFNSEADAVANAHANLAELYANSSQIDLARNAFRAALRTGRNRSGVCGQIANRVSRDPAFHDLKADYDAHCS